MYDLTIFKLHGGRLTLKIYTKGERVLRVEAMAHNTRALGDRCALAELPRILGELKAVLERFLDALACIDRCFIGGETLDTLPLPSQVGHTNVGGIDLAKPRMRWVAEAVLALATSPRGFTASDLARQVQRLGGSAAAAYTPRRAAYDLKKLRGETTRAADRCHATVRSRVERAEDLGDRDGASHSRHQAPAGGRR